VNRQTTAFVVCPKYIRWPSELVTVHESVLLLWRMSRKDERLVLYLATPLVVDS